MDNHMLVSDGLHSGILSQDWHWPLNRRLELSHVMSEIIESSSSSNSSNASGEEQGIILENAIIKAKHGQGAPRKKRFSSYLVI